MNPLPIIAAQLRVLQKDPWMILFAPVFVLIAVITAATVVLVGGLRALATLAPRR
ncbi:MAG TPA: hypothetical protein VF699_06115 [Caulobacteraceae bacterium]|jgi:hypothetical protein